MIQQLLPESPEKTRQHVEGRETGADSAPSFQGGILPILQLQRALGNRNVAKLIQAKQLTPGGKIIGLQRKLTVGAADDQYEQEADRVARQVMNTPDAVVTASAERASSLGGAQNQALQTKPLAASITPIVQRQREKENDVEDDQDGEEEKDESLQAKSFSLQMNQAENSPASSSCAPGSVSAGGVPALGNAPHSSTPTAPDAGAAAEVKKMRSDPDPIAPTVRTREPTAKTGAVIQRDFLDTLGDAADTVSDAASSAADTVSDVAGDAVDAVSDAASDAVDAVSGLIDSAIGELRGAFDAIVGQINGVWDTVKSGVTNAVEGAIREASGFLDGIGAFFGAIGTALSSLDVDSLRAAWAAITGAANAALAGVQGIVAQVTATVDGLWSGLKGLADGLIGGLQSQAEGLIGRLPGPAQGPARSLWSTIEGKMTSTWRTIESSWNSLRESALKSVNQVVARVEGVVTSIKNSVITTIIETLDQVKGLFTFVKQAIANPDSLIDPIVQEIAGRLQGLPDKAKGDAQTKAQEQATSGPGAAGAGPAGAKAAPAMAATAAPGAVVIQRVIQRNAAPAAAPRSTLGVVEVISGCWDFITDKLAKIWGNLWATIKEMVIGVLDPRAIWKGLKEDWEHMTKELSTRASRFESIRTDSWDGFSEDLARFLSNLVDFPLIIWRTVNAMLGRLSVYIGLAIILGGAVAGAIAGGTGGAVFGGILGEGVAALPGGAAGVAAGAWAGAQAGYALAETVGLVLLVSFVAAEEFSIIKALNNLLWVPQNEEEQNEDFNQATDSTIAIATAALLIAIAFIGTAIAKRVWAFVKGIPGRFKPKPKVVEPEPAPPKPGEPVSANPDKLVICRVCDTVPNVPADLMAKRAKLTPEARARLDKEAKAIFPDPANPTTAQFDALRQFMEAMEKIGGGDLEVGLLRAVREDTLSIDPQTLNENPKSRAEARTVLQAEDLRLIQGKARRPDLSKGEPNLDFLLDDANGKTIGYAEIKTPVDPKLNPIVNQARDIAGNIRLYSPDVKIIIELKNLSPPDKAIFKAELVKNGADIKKIIFVNE